MSNELEKTVDTAKQNLEREYNSLMQRIIKALGDVIRISHLDDIAHVRNVTENCADIEVKRDGMERGHAFKVYFDTTGDYENHKRVIKMGVGAFGAFSANDTAETDFYIVVGKFATCLEEIQGMFDTIDFKALEDARLEFRRAQESHLNSK